MSKPYVNFSYVRKGVNGPELVMFGELIGMIRYIEYCLDNELKVEIERLRTGDGKKHLRLVAKCPAEIGMEKVMDEVYKKWEEIYNK